MFFIKNKKTVFLTGGGFEPCMNLLRIFMPENALVGLKVLVLVRSPIVVFKRLPPFRIKKPVNYD